MPSFHVQHRHQHHHQQQACLDQFNHRQGKSVWKVNVGMASVYRRYWWSSHAIPLPVPRQPSRRGLQVKLLPCRHLVEPRTLIVCHAPRALSVLCLRQMPHHGPLASPWPSRHTMVLSSHHGPLESLGSKKHLSGFMLTCAPV